MAAANVDPAKTTAQRVEQDIAKLGFKIRFRVAAQDALYTTFCGTPAARVAICPNIGWQRDFVDAQAMLDAPFNAKHISPQNNTNMSQLDDPAINAAIDQAERTPGGPERDRAWGRIDAMVTRTAAAIPWIWDRTPLVRSRDVHGATNSYTTVWDLSFTSLE
jgi:peptide/nickel transport system substrate-binding protein